LGIKQEARHLRKQARTRPNPLEDSMNTTLAPEAEAAKLWRRLPAARNRAITARLKALRTPTEDRLTAASELEAGLVRMETAYYTNLAQVA
jgi:hypothetical protein